MTVMRTAVGYGQRYHHISITDFELSSDLPMVITMID
jgi:PII-like signaling protein